jgi:hypothetical protein
VSPARCGDPTLRIQSHQQALASPRPPASSLLWDSGLGSRDSASPDHGWPKLSSCLAIPHVSILLLIASVVVLARVVIFQGAYKMRIVSIFSAAGLIASTIAFDCSIYPIYIDIHDRRVATSEIEEYGTFIGIGTPSQNQSLWPALSHNETTLASTQFCSQGSSSNCRDNSHSIFEPGLSSSYVYSFLTTPAPNF